MHADQLKFLETSGAADYLNAEDRERRYTAAYDPCAFATWAEARHAYPANALILIIDITEGKHFVAALPPFPDASDLAQDGRVYVAGWLDCDGNELPDDDLPEIFRVYDAGKFVPPFKGR